VFGAVRPLPNRICPSIHDKPAIDDKFAIGNVPAVKPAVSDFVRRAGTRKPSLTACCAKLLNFGIDDRLAIHDMRIAARGGRRNVPSMTAPHR
jgi:hypothetical protein